MPTSTTPAAAEHVVIRPLTRADTAQTAALQLAELPRSFVVQLGPRFVRGLHAAFLTSPHCVGLAAVSREDPHRLLGFVLGSTDAARHASHVLARSRLRLGALGLLALLTHPGLLPRFARRRARRYASRLLHPRRGRRPPGAGSAGPSAGPAAVVTVLVVAPEGRLQGIGGALAGQFLDRARAARSAAVLLVTRADETGAAAFWKRMGWEEVDVHQNLDGDLVRSLSRPLP